MSEDDLVTQARAFVGATPFETPADSLILDLADEIELLRAMAKELADALESDLNDGGETKVSERTLNALKAVRGGEE